MTSQFDLAGFIEAVCKDEAQLEAGGDQMDTEEGLDEQEIANNVAPPWSRARRMLSKRQMAKISPRLGLLNNLPMTLPFAARVQILSEFIK
jgi:ubiquitin-protein ligase E3 C